MSQLQQLTTRDIWCPSEEYPVPGVFVKHVKDDKSYGMIVARVGNQVSVLWSRQPQLDPMTEPTHIAQILKLQEQQAIGREYALRAMGYDPNARPDE
jgi:hypothetical protein